jgi:hypothetical protein
MSPKGLDLASGNSTESARLKAVGASILAFIGRLDPLPSVLRLSRTTTSAEGIPRVRAARLWT